MQQRIAEKGISTIFHFTPVANISSILQHGLLSIDYLSTHGIEHFTNDELRIDNCTNAICCSISHPNYRTFYRMRNNAPNNDWVVISISPSILYNKDCAFCIENAASANVTCIPIEQRKGINAFDLLFSENPAWPTRADLGIEDKYPTNPQAEVLVFDCIETDLFLEISCSSFTKMVELRASFPTFSDIIYYNLAPFLYRSDYAHWRG